MICVAFLMLAEFGTPDSGPRFSTLSVGYISSHLPVGKRISWGSNFFPNNL
jgi:hypothetical protein